MDTIAISLWKFIGTSIPCGVALSSKNFTDFAFSDGNFIKYVEMKDTYFISSTRSGLAAATSLHIVKSLEMDKGTH